MNIFIDTNTMEYPLFEGDIRLLFPDIAEDQTGNTFPVPNGYALVEDTEMPSYDEDAQILSEDKPIFTNEKWKRVWTIRNMTEEELLEQRKFKEPPKMNVNLNNPGTTPDVIG